VAFATKPQLAKAMIGRAIQAGVRFMWVIGDEAYGGNPACGNGWRKRKSRTCSRSPATR
jgi:SRSO17 transposase